MVYEHAMTKIEARTKKRASGCWEWMGPLRDGVGQIRLKDGRRDNVQRVAYRVHVGVIPDGYEVKRTCCNGRCVRPKHLRAVSRGTRVSQLERERMWEGNKGRRKNRALSTSQVATIRRWKAAGKVLKPLAERYGVSAVTIYAVAGGWRYAPDRPPLTDGEVRSIRERYRAGEAGTRIAAEFNVSQSLVYGIGTGRFYNRVA